MKAEIARREKAGWSIWSTQPIGDIGVLVMFKYPGEFVTDPERA
jgi:hypothetical protein